jgi:glycerophosphoryl diester phosphodiesterase
MRFSPQLRELEFLVARPIAHRGLHDKAIGIVENTASAFGRACAMGYAIECDLQLTSDREAVVFHDDALDRLTNATGRVRDMTAAQMKAVSIRGTGDRVQTLGELLQQVAGRVPLLIELKSRWNGDERLVVRALEVLENYEGPYCLMSFDPDTIAAIRMTSPGTVRGIVAGRASHEHSTPVNRRIEFRTLSHLGRTRPDFISFDFSDLPWAPAMTFRAAGNPMISWTIRSAEQAAYARRYSDQITFEQYFA